MTPSLLMMLNLLVGAALIVLGATSENWMRFPSLVIGASSVFVAGALARLL